MRRFIKAYLTIVAGLILLANFVLVLIYGRQFLIQASVDCVGPVGCGLGASGFLWGVVIFNGVALAISAVIWLLIVRAVPK